MQAYMTRSLGRVSGVACHVWRRSANHTIHCVSVPTRIRGRKRRGVRASELLGGMSLRRVLHVRQKGKVQVAQVRSISGVFVRFHPTHTHAM